MREEFLQLAGKLGRERLVGRHHQRGLSQRLDGLRHGEGLSRPCHAQEHLISVAILNAPNEGGDGLWLITGRLKRRDDLEWRGFTCHAETPQLTPDALHFKIRHGGTANLSIGTLVDTAPDTLSAPW